MADQYQNFTNPTIIPEQQYGSQFASQQLGGIGEALKQQALQRQAIQQSIAQEAAKAQFEVWSKMQDPIARALTMGKLGEMGYPIGQMQGAMGGNMPSMGQMMQGNPYANLVPNFQNQQPQINTPSPSSPGLNMSQPGGQGANFNSLNPVQGSQQPQGQGNFVTPEIKMGPFGAMPSPVTDVNAQNQIAGNKSYSEAVGTQQGKQATGTAMLDSITRNLAADLKSHFIEAGGGGPLKGNVTGMLTNFGMSPATTGLKNTVRDSAIAYARDLAGGSQGVQRMFQSIMETIPNTGSTQEQAGTALLQMHLTAAQLQAGMSALGLSPQDLTNMTEQQIQDVMSKGVIDRQAETNKFGQILSDTQPTKVMNMEGKQSDPQLNPILSMFQPKNNFGEGFQGKANPKSQAMLQQYKAKYPNRTDQEILQAMQKQGLM